MSSGELRDRIIFLKEAPWIGPVKPLRPEYEEYTKTWAKIEYLKGREFWAAKAVEGETTVKFKIRYRTDIAPDMKIDANGKMFDITGILPADNKKAYMFIYGEEVEAVGR